MLSPEHLFRKKQIVFGTFFTTTPFTFLNSAPPISRTPERVVFYFRL